MPRCLGRSLKDLKRHLPPSPQHGQAGGAEQEGNGEEVHFGYEVWVDEKSGVLMKPQLYTLQNWEGWGWKPMLLASVAHTVSIPYQVHQTSFPALTQESTPLTSACTAQLSILKIHPSLWGSEAIKKGLQEPNFQPLVPHHYSDCEKHILLRRKGLSLGFLICTKKAWALSFNLLGRHMAYFQSSGILMS